MRTQAGFRAIAAIAVVGATPFRGACVEARAGTADTLIVNARVIVAPERVIERGFVAIKGGRIAAVGAGAANLDAAAKIDAKGMSLMPGLIDVHVHLITGPKPQGIECEKVVETLGLTLAQRLARGFTTIMSPGDRLPDIEILKERIAKGEVRGPRLLTVGEGFTAPGHPTVVRAAAYCDSKLTPSTAEQARADVQKLAAAGVDGIKIVYDSKWPPVMDDAIVSAIVEEAHKYKLPVQAHVQTVDDALKAVALGVDKLNHFPHAGSISPEALKTLRDRHIPVATTVHLHAPIETAGRSFNHGDMEIAPQSLPARQAHVSEMLASIRTLTDAGIVLAFGTDPWRGQSAAQDPIEHELQTLGKGLSPREIVSTLTAGAARYLGLAEQIGTIEAGKMADLVLIDGDPLSDLSSLRSPKVVIQRGAVVTDVR